MSRKSPWKFLKSKRTFFFIATIGFLFKYWLVLGEEIEPFYRPADDLNYVKLAQSWYWWAEYNAYSFLRPPVWPLFLALVDVSEIPLRIIQELLLCGSTFFLINRFRKNGLNATMAGICFVIIIHHPGWLLLANRTLRECFYGSGLLILIGFLVPLANRRLSAVHWYQLLPSGFTAALLWHTREESILIALLLAAFVVIFWLLKQELPAWKTTVRQLGWVALGFAGPILTTNLAIRSTNLAVHGLFITHEFKDPAFKKAHKRLMQIKPLNPKPWVNIEQESLEKAYASSFNLRSIKEALSGRVGPRWAEATVSMTHDPKEIGGGTFLFALREAAMEEGIYSDAMAAHRFYQKIANELEKGFESGKLQKRFVLSSFVDPEVSDYIKRLPDGLLNVGSFAFKPLQDTDIRIYYPRHEVFDTLEIYDQVANRRQELAYRKVNHIRGWAFISEKEITKIEVIDHNGVQLDSTTNIHARPDVVAAYESEKPPEKSGFKISLPKADYPGSKVIIRFHSSDGKNISMSASKLLKLGQEQIQEEDGPLLRVTVDEITSGKDNYAKQDAIQAWLWLNHGKFHQLFAGTAILVLLVRYVLFKKQAPGRHYYRWILFLLMVIVSRWLLVTLIDISSFRIDLRYIFPALIFVPLLFGLVLQEALAGFKAKRMRW